MASATNDPANDTTVAMPSLALEGWVDAGLKSTLNNARTRSTAALAGAC
jgi:hypothetical protein